MPNIRQIMSKLLYSIKNPHPATTSNVLNSTPLNAWQWMGTMNGGEVIQSF